MPPQYICLGKGPQYLSRAENERRTMFLYISYAYLSHDVTVIQWITSCHKNNMTIREITLWHVYVMSLTTSVSTIRLLLEILFNLKAIESHFKGPYDKQNFTHVYEMTTHVRSSINISFGKSGCVLFTLMSTVPVPCLQCCSCNIFLCGHEEK